MGLQRVGHDWATNTYYVLSHFSHVQLFVTPWTVTCQAPLSMEFSRQEYWSGLLFPSPGDLSDLGAKLCFLYLLHWQVGSLPLASPGKSWNKWLVEFESSLKDLGVLTVCLVELLAHFLPPFGKGNEAVLALPGSIAWGLFLRVEFWVKEGNGNPLQYPCLENLTDRGAW